MTDPLVPQKKCPWDGATPTVDKGLANRKDLGRRTKSAFAYIRCPTCGVEKGVISMEGDHDEEAAVREAVKLWDTRPSEGIAFTPGELAALSAIAREGFDALDAEERSQVVGPKDAQADATTAVAAIRRAMRTA